MTGFRLLATLLVLCIAASIESVAQEANISPTLAKSELGSTLNVHAFGPNLLCGQPSAEEFAEAKQRGIKTVITLRQEGEVEWDEPGTINNLDLEFHRFGFRAPDSLTDDIFDQSLKILSDPKKSPVMLHCGSANRVGAIWLAHRVVNDGIAIDAARSEAMMVGLRTPGYEEKALAYIESRKSKREESVRPGINDSFIDPQLDISEWLGRFEIESREVYAAREQILKACGVKEGFHVADVGAGTGLFTRLFANAVGETGWVFAVDISPKFLEHINKKSNEDNVENITSVLGSDRSIRLPSNALDFVFICDTYHHFEFPRSTLASIHRSLKPGGSLVVIDFERIPGKSREFVMGHVRAGKEVFQGEITETGFDLVKEIKLPELKENYFLQFVKR